MATLVLGGATIFDALGLIDEPPAALAAVVALLLLGACTGLGTRAEAGSFPRRRSLAHLGIAIAWIAMFTIPFALRLFPGARIATAVFEPRHLGERFALGHGSVDLILDAELPPPSGRDPRELHYALTMTDDSGTSYHLTGALGDRWESRRLGRRGTTPVHIEHLSIRHVIENVGGGSLRLDDATVTGIPSATIAGGFYPHKLPNETRLFGSGLLIVLAALAFDLRWFPQQPSLATLVTASAAGAALVFCGSTTGHPGLRQVFGSTIVGAMGGMPTAGLLAWLARRSSWARAITCRRAT